MANDLADALPIREYKPDDWGAICTWDIYAMHYLGLAPLRDWIARPLILQLSEDARRQQRMSPQQRAFEAQSKRAALLKRQREQEVSRSQWRPLVLPFPTRPVHAPFACVLS